MKKKKGFQMPKHVHPLVYQFAVICRDSDLSLSRISKNAGLAETVVHGWFNHYTPNVTNFTAALNSLGYDLAIQPLGSDKICMKCMGNGKVINALDLVDACPVCTKESEAEFHG